MPEFVMPSLGADMDAGTLVEWKKPLGAFVKRGEILAEVETDKGVISVEAFHEGVVERYLVEPGTRVPVGTPLAMIGEGPALAALFAKTVARILAGRLAVTTDQVGASEGA